MHTDTGRVGGGWASPARPPHTCRTLSVDGFEQIPKQNAVGETLSSSLNDISKYLVLKLYFKRHGEGEFFR